MELDPGLDPGSRSSFTPGYILECCLEGVESVRQACRAGANRIELCANLAQGGVTPSLGDIEAAVSLLRGCDTRLHVIIRPRPGDFVYTDLEKQVMVKDIEAAVKAGAHGVVIGALREDGGIDEDMTREMMQTAATAASPRSCSITFHRAFDVSVTEPLDALDALLRLGVDRVLTSGGARSAWDGRHTIAKLVRASEGRIIVMPGAGVTRANIKLLMTYTGAREVHVGSACHEHVSRERIQQHSDFSGLMGEGSGLMLKRVSRSRVTEFLHELAGGPASGHPV